MEKSLNRRELLGAAGAVLLTPLADAQTAQPVRVGGQDVEVQIAPVSAVTFRLSILPIQDGKAAAVPQDGALVQSAWGPPAARFRTLAASSVVTCGGCKIDVSLDPLQFTIRGSAGETVQQLKVDRESGALSFVTGNAPLLALGEGGPQFDRRGSTDQMRSGQGGYRLQTFGGRVPIQWLIGTGGWAFYINHPLGTFDFTGAESKFLPRPNLALPLDLFFVASRQPSVIMAEWTRLTGHAELAPLWSFGYQQSHRTLADRDEVLAEARTFREKKLPCDALIYLGTGFCPSGWNTYNGEFAFNQKVFPDPKAMIDQLHADHFKVVLHAVINSRTMQGTVRDACDLQQPAEQQPSCYWNAHRPVYALGVDGWWPDEGDPMNAPSRLARNRMYWEAPQLDRPNERPFALHRNGHAGMQRYGSFLWSGDVYSRWETLKNHVPVAVNVGLTGIPYWGTDIGGFVPTPEFDHELYVRWFQFGAFCTLFRSHGRTWKLRLPWGWNTGDVGPAEIAGYQGAGLPAADQLHHPEVEGICRKYLELRYRMMPYLYSAVRESCTSGLPVMRSLWLHYPDDPAAVVRGDEYLWGRDLLVAPVVEKGAASRTLYLPRGSWHDFWTQERVEGGREVTRPVDLETTPLYARAGAIVPMGPVKQFTGEKVDGPLTVAVYPGADGRFLLYEDDGRSFDYRRGAWMGIEMVWSDARRTLSLRLAAGSRMLPPARRALEIHVGKEMRTAAFDGRPLEIKF